MKTAFLLAVLAVAAAASPSMLHAQACNDYTREQLTAMDRAELEREYCRTAGGAGYDAAGPCRGVLERISAVLVAKHGVVRTGKAPLVACCDGMPCTDDTPAVRVRP